MLKKTKSDYCVIGGLAVNAYCEPVVSLDLDLVIAAKSFETFIKSAQKIFKIKNFAHSVNLSSAESDLRIQIQIDKRYLNVIPRASTKKVLGYKMKVAAVEDILQGKIWAYSDEGRRKSKRQKDLADIFRLVESHPRLKKLLPEPLKKIVS
ncbi:MAG TPA: nucleotidyl transferase AbiEii/AbiGii toxin family protein [bacterium]